MDASTYLRRKKEAMAMYIASPKFMDAGLRSEVLGKAAATIQYISPNTSITPINPCTTAKVAYTGSDAATPIKPAPGCCAVQYTTPYTAPCAPMLYTSTSYVEACKVLPYDAPPSAMKTAVARHTNNCC